MWKILFLQAIDVWFINQQKMLKICIILNLIKNSFKKSTRYTIIRINAVSTIIILIDA